jgi:hypothetical protein
MKLGVNYSRQGKGIAFLILESFYRLHRLRRRLGQLIDRNYLEILLVSLENTTSCLKKVRRIYQGIVLFLGSIPYLRRKVDIKKIGAYFFRRK